ncbi:DNA resolvase [Brucella sp. TWI432]
MLAGLEHRMMTPEIVADAMRSFVEENNRLNREHRVNAKIWQSELQTISTKVSQIVEAIADGMYHPSMKQKMDQLEARKAELTTLLTNLTDDMPDILPSASAVYAKQVAALTKALNSSDERQTASQHLRQLIERIVLKPGAKRGQVDATLRGELGTILNWTEQQAIGKISKTTKPLATATGLLYRWLRGHATTDTGIR